MIKFKDVEEFELIPKEILRTLPRRCRCGADIEFTESLYHVRCSNENCMYKMIASIQKMLNTFNIKSWTDDEIETIITKFKFTIPYQIFLINQIQQSSKTASINDFQGKVREIEALKSRPMELWFMINAMGIEYVSSSAYDICNGYDSVDKLYNDIEAMQIAFISERLGIRGTEGSEISLLVYEKLIEYKEQITLMESLFNIVKYKSDPLRIAVIGEIDGFANRISFMDYLSLRYRGRTRFALVGIVDSTTDIAVIDIAVNSPKYKTAKRINDSYRLKALEAGDISEEQIDKFESPKDLLKVGEKIALCSSEELIERLDRVYGQL